MLRYLKAAFLLKLPLPGLGWLPVNVLAMLGFLMLGFGSPGFWLLGLGLEIIYLYAVSTNPRFKRWVDLQGSLKGDQAFAQQWETLVDQLGPFDRDRVYKLQHKCDQVIRAYQDAHASEYMIQSNQDALRQLSWLYLKLLIAKQNLQSLSTSTGITELKSRIQSLQTDLENKTLSEPIRESKSATLEILEKRLQNLNQRDASLQEIDSDLSRIEAQVDLALENATMQGQPQAISTNIDLYSHVLDGQLFGDSAQSIADIDQKLKQASNIIKE